MLGKSQGVSLLGDAGVNRERDGGRTHLLADHTTKRPPEGGLFVLGLIVVTRMTEDA